MSFTEVAGQWTRVERPPNGYIILTDHIGRQVGVSIDLLVEAPQVAVQELWDSRDIRVWREPGVGEGPAA